MDKKKRNKLLTEYRRDFHHHPEHGSRYGPPHRYSETVAEFQCGDETFTAKGKTVLDVGWKAIEKPAKAKAKRI